MKLISFLILMIPATFAEAKWEKMMNYDGADFFVDLGTAKRGLASSSYTLLENYLSGDFAGESSIQFIQVKCRSLKRKMVEAYYYSRHFGQGRLIDYLQHEDWVKPENGSVSDVLDRAMCGYMKSKK